MTKLKILILISLCYLSMSVLSAQTSPDNTRIIYVSQEGSNRGSGTASSPYRTISYAASQAEPGTTVRVESGTYRERINPPRGGTSDDKRIVFEAAPDAEVIIKGSEIIFGWKRFKGNVWMVAIGNNYFKDYNPYKELIAGDWFDDYGQEHHTGEVYLNEEALFEAGRIRDVLHPRQHPLSELGSASLRTWYCETDEDSTYIWANFQGADPNEELVEINVRPTCFYPEKPGINFITVRGFKMMQAATQWAPPTAEQIGLIGTHWSKGWIIEDNIISHSRCTGITLGKDRASGQNVWSANPEIDGATHYNELIQKALQPPSNWSKENIGSHIVRNNEIAHCEQAGICGSMGGAFSTIEGNYIHDIWEKRQFGGAELGGIKLHGPVDCLIKGNRIARTPKGMWLDWMTQGTRVTGNLIYGTYTEDLFVEVNHGPFLIDNNLFLSNCVSILDGSGGGAYVHNLINNKLMVVQQGRETPYLGPHQTQVWGHAITRNGDNRFFNNIFLSVDDEVTDTMPNPWWKDRGGVGLKLYQAYFPMYVNGNVYLKGADPYPQEKSSLHLPEHDTRLRIEERGDEVWIRINIPKKLARMRVAVIDSDDLGSAKVPDARFEQPDGSDWILNLDYFGKERPEGSNTPGPFIDAGKGEIELRVW